MYTRALDRLFRVRSLVGSIRKAFSPRDLFSTGANGVWYDPSDYGTLFQDAAGTTPVTAVEQPVGLMLDKSKGLVLGPELVTNGTFDTDISGWNTPENNSGTLVLSSNAMRVTRVGSVAAGSQGISVTSGKTYKVSCTFSVVSGAGVGLYLLFKTTDNATGLTSGSSTKTASAGSSGTLTFIYTAASTTTLYLMGLLFGGGVGAVDFDNISVRELPGNHAYNPSGNSANFPVLSARYNLLRMTEQFDDAAWVKFSATVSANTTETTDPLGGNTADSLTATGPVAAVCQIISPSFTSAISYKFSCCVKAGTNNYVYLKVASSGATSVVFDLANIVIGETIKKSGPTISASSISDAGNGWRVCSITFSDSTNEYVQIGFAPLATGNTSDVYANITGNTNGNTLFVRGADLRVSNDALNQPAYQRVNTATDYDTVGFKPYLSFNGVNQWLQTNSIDFTYGDKMFVSAGVRKLSGAAGMISELSTDTNGNNGSMMLFSPTGYYWRSKGTIAADVAADTFISPITNVVSGLGNISGDSSIVRANGTQLTPTTTDQGTGNFGNYPLYIGARAGSSLWFNGRLYGLIIVGKAVRSVEITSTEAWLNNKTRAY